MRARSRHRWPGPCPVLACRCVARRGDAEARSAAWRAWQEPASVANGGAILSRPEERVVPCARQVEPSGIDEEPMHGDAGSAKLGERSDEVRRAASGHSNDHVGGVCPVEKLVRVDRCPPGRGQDRPGDGGPDGGIGTADSRRSDDRASTKPTIESPLHGFLPRVRTSLRAARRAPTSTTRVCPSVDGRGHEVIEIIHESRCRLTPRQYGFRSRVRGGPNCVGRGTYHPGQTSRETDSFKLFDRPVRR